MTTFHTRCHAKVNLFLAVGKLDHRRYHPIRTIMQTVSLADELEVEVGAAADQFEVIGASLPEDNSVTKAIRLAREFVDVPRLGIKLTKNIPSEAGLGGGSSDAAGILRILGAAPSRLSFAAQLEIAGAVGCDVPFFLYGGLAKATGYGEIVEPLPDPTPKTLIIAKPNLGISTALAYAGLDSADFPWRDFPANSEELYNDFERVAPCECGEIAERMMIHGASAAQLTGSGSAVFGIVKSEEADRIRKQIESEFGAKVYVATTVSAAEAILVEARH